MSHHLSAAGQPAGHVSAPGASDAGAPDPARARRGVLAYLGTVVVLSGAVQAIIYVSRDWGFITLLMWTPALASVLVRFVRNEGFADVSFAFGGRRTWVAIGLAFLLPFVVGFVGHGIAWGVGLAQFAPPEALPLFGDVSGAGGHCAFSSGPSSRSCSGS